jgi:acyl-CoA oxidase
VAKTYALDFAHKHLVARYVCLASVRDPAGAREVERLAAGVKAVTTWHTTRVLQECREACGGEGYMSRSRLPALKADADIFTTFEGDNTVLMVWIGRLLLMEALRGPDGDGKSEAPAPGKSGQEAGQYYQWLLHQREKQMLAQTAASYNQRLATGVEPHQAAAQEQLALFRLARAHMERVVLDEFARGIEDGAEPGVRDMLMRLRDLFALGVIEEGRAWFLENGLLQPEESCTVPAQVDDLCAQLAPDAVVLVDAFGIPEECLASEIGPDPALAR